MNMQRVAPLVSKNIGNYLNNKQTWSDILFNVKSFGATGDGATDDTAAVNRAIAEAAKDGGIVFFPPGRYIVTSSIFVNGPVTIEGAGRNASIILSIYEGDLFSIESTGVEVSRLKISNVGNPSSGSGIKLKSGAFATIDTCQIEGFYDNVNVVDAYSWTIQNTYIVNPIRWGVYIRNTALGDTGDQVIQSCTFDSSNDAPAAIRHESGGGVKIQGNKILRYQIGYDLQVADGVNTSVALIDGNSIEMQSIRHIRMGRLGTTGNYSMIVVSDNQHNYLTALTDGVYCGDGLNDVTISGNVSNGPSDAPYIQLAGGTDYLIEGNKISGFEKGIQIGSAVIGVRVGINGFENVGRPIEDNTPNPVDRPTDIHHHYKKVIDVSSDSSYANLFRIDLAQYRGCTLHLDIEGLVQGAGPVARSISKLLTRSDTACTVTAVADTSGASDIDVQFDVSVTGSVIIGVKRNSGAGGTLLQGTATLRILGSVQAMNIL